MIKKGAIAIFVSPLAAGLKCRSQVTGYRSDHRPQVTHKNTHKTVLD